MKITEFELPEPEIKMMEDWIDMAHGRKKLDAEKNRIIESWMTGFLAAKITAAKSK